MRRVFTEMSTVVQTIFFQGAVRTICAASGSNHKLNSWRGVFTNSGSSVTGLQASTHEDQFLCQTGDSGSIAIARAIFVNGPPP